MTSLARLLGQRCARSVSNFIPCSQPLGSMVDCAVLDKVDHEW